MVYDVDVYLSFRGQDTRFGFTDHLYHALQRAGIYVFRDDLELQKGDQISHSLIQAIKVAKISIVVFSKNYANSSWCLQELENIIQCERTTGQRVVPVFYGVDPSDVRHQKGQFGEAFKKHRKRISEDKVNVWAAALRDASNFSGFDLRNGYESELIENIVESVASLLDSTDLFTAEHLVGVQSHVQDVTQLLNCQKSKDVLLIGLWGIGGTGKTIIAKAVYNQIRHNFEGQKFLSNIREIWENDQVLLQQQLLRGIDKTTEAKINNIESGVVILKERLCGKRVFLVLDDVNKMDQLNALCGSRGWFGPGSRIIITTRDKRLLSMLGVDHVYRVKELDYNESIELFSWYAFKKATPPEDFCRLSKDVVAYSRGLPLALIAFGYELSGKRIEEWENILDDLKRFPHPEVQKVLKISFDGLSDDTQKEIFLDIASFCIGMDRNDVMQTLSAFGQQSAKTGIRLLEEQCLVTIDEKNKLRMHPLLRDMGREIIREKSQTEPQQRMYDAFLSFRGKDTRATFTSHLYTSLENAGIYVFKDDDKLPRGERISISLLKAIGRSLSSVIVLSTNYADSRWCLQELENIMVCHRTKGQVVVPVFYNVDPSEVRHQTGMFGRGFEDLIKGYSVEEDKELSWRTALRELGGLSGIVMVNSRNESEDIRKVVEHVTRLLDRTELFVADHPVGVTSRVQEVIEKLNIQQSKDVLLLGIRGMGGTGKTTITKAIYNQIGCNFEGKSFLLNIREVWEQDNGHVLLQEQVLSDIYKTTMIQIHSTESGKNILKEKLSQRKILLVLDDVDELDQLKALCGNREWFGLGSRIIITTRDERLLKVHGVDHIYEIKQMNDVESVELFSWHAFKQATPRKDFVGLSGDVVAYANGLPLALEVLGSYLFDRGIREWKDVLEQLKIIPNDKVQKKLKISFDGLDNHIQKEIFLDITCFFIGMDRKDVVQILKGCGLYAEIAISVLIERSLVTIDNKNKLRMHDLLQDMGREIIRERSPEPEGRSRLWFDEEVLDLLEKYEGTKAAKGLALKLPRTNLISLRTEAFKNMTKLKLLQLAGVQLNGDFKYLSRDLRWMNWHGCPLRHTPVDCYQGNLVAIELEYSSLKLVWKEAQLLNKLKMLNLSHSHCLRATPDFSYLPNLEKLILKDCINLSSVSHTIGYLKEVVVINLKGCTSLRVLPRSIYKLKSLETLILSGCVMIDKLEEDLEQMESLTVLKANNTAITQVPNALVRLKSIGYISLGGFEGLARDVIPSIIWSWTAPTNMFSSLMQTSSGMSCTASLDVPSSSLRAKRGPQLQITGDVALDAFNVANCNELEARPTTSQVSNLNTGALIDCCSQGDISESKTSLNSISIQMGMNSPITEILGERISEKLRKNELGDCLLPSNRNPALLTFSGEGSSVIFHVPQVNGQNLKAMILCIFYSSSTDIIATEGLILKNVLIINHTKKTPHVYEGDILTSFKDEDGKSLISNLEPGDRVQVVVVFEYGFIVKKTKICLIYDEPIDQNTEHCHADVSVSCGNNAVSGGDRVVADLNENAPGVDDIAAHENVFVSTGDDMVADMNASSVDDMAINENVIVSDTPADNNNDNISGGDENRFGRFFKLPSLVRAILKTRPFWFGLLLSLVWITCRHSNKGRKLNLISRYALRWKWLVDCKNKLIACKKANKANGSIVSSSSVR